MTTRPRILDLFCGAGGAAMGYHRAGFDVVGVDIKHQPNYPFEFVQADALGWLRVQVECGWDGEPFDAIHASPPCQLWSNPTRDASRHKDLISPLRPLLVQTGLPYVIENVPRAPLRKDLMLCGSMFGLGSGGRHLRRHRVFELNFPVVQPACIHKGYAVGVYGGGTWDNNTGEVRNRGGYRGSKEEGMEAMEIDWMDWKELREAIPPAYTEYIGKALFATMRL